MERHAQLRMRAAGSPTTGVPRQRRVSVRAQAQASAKAPVSRDLTAGLLQTALTMGLRTRLRAHADINVDVHSTASGLMQGIFGGMAIRGRGWETPLSLTADAIEVEVGELQLDYSALIGGAVALRNLPTGSCSLRLTAEDLGNLMEHPLMAPVAAKAVGGKAFKWDRQSVRILRDEKTGLGCADFEGRWEHDGASYRVRMVPVPPAPASPSSPPRAKGYSKPARTELRVSARRLSSPDPAPSSTPSASDAAAPAAGPSGTLAVAQGLGQMFSKLQLNLDGIELQKPTLEVLLPGEHEEGREPLLQIHMQMKIRAIPPLNMKF